MVYLAHPHTASRSTSQALLKLGFVKKGMENHHATLYESGVVTKDNRKDWTVFTTVRNHFDWILAQVWKIETASHPGPEIDWTDLDMWKRNLARSNWVTENTLFSRHAPDADIVLNFETLGPDLEAVLGSVKLPRIGRTEPRTAIPGA